MVSIMAAPFIRYNQQDNIIIYTTYNAALQKELECVEIKRANEGES
jgi:hypothetical protein